MKKEKISFFYQILVITSLLMGILLSLANTTFLSFLLSYYTMWSNLFCLMIYFFLFTMDGINKKARKNWYYLLKGAMRMAILLTFVIYLIGLLPKRLPMYAVLPYEQGITSKQIANALVHIISPLLVIGDYYFDSKGHLKNSFPIISLIFPAFYVCFVYSGKGKFYSIGGSRKYAYYFLDYEQIGKNKVIAYIVGIVVGMLVIGYLIVKLDQKLATKAKEKKNHF